MFVNWFYSAFLVSLVFVILAENRVRFVLSTSPYFPIKSKQRNYSCPFVFLFFAVLLFVVVCREGFVDTANYIEMYQQIGPHVKNAFNDTVPRVEEGYLFITALLNMISTDPQLLLIVFGHCEIFGENFFFFDFVCLQHLDFLHERSETNFCGKHHLVCGCCFDFLKNQHQEDHFVSRDCGAFEHDSHLCSLGHSFLFSCKRKVFEQMGDFGISFRISLADVSVYL